MRNINLSVSKFIALNLILAILVVSVTSCAPSVVEIELPEDDGATIYSTSQQTEIIPFKETSDEAKELEKPQETTEERSEKTIEETAEESVEEKIEESAEETSEETSQPRVVTAVDEDSTTVYVGKTGTKYHYSTCGTLKGGGQPIPMSEALAQGRTSCKVCHR